MRKAMLIALAVLFMTSCSALQMTVSDIKLDLYDSSHFDADTFKMAHPEKCGILLGTIANEQSTPGRVVVLAFPDAPVNTKASDRAALHDAGSYMLCVPAGRYRIVAFEDFNDNRICDQNEMVGRLESPEIVSVEEGMVIGGLDFTIGGQGSNFLDFPIDVKLPAAVIGGGKSLERGAVISLDEAVFARSYGSIGLWSPSRFIEEIGVQIYGLDRYDDSKIPVLFVHGSGGTPRDWQYLSRNMDVNRFQRWFFYYPTGLPLETVSALIYEKLSQLHAVYRFPRLCIVAHSMGGLVVRSFLNRYALQSPPYEVMLFISMSTPWGGVKRAELAPRPGESLFKSPPVWKDLVPGSSFLKKLHSQCLPRSVRYYLIFGDKRPSPLVTEAGDGVIRLDSQLHPEARAEAEGVFGFHEDHSGILRSEAALERYRDILSSVTPSGSCR